MNDSTGKRGRTRTAGPPPDERLGRNRVRFWIGTSPGLATGMTQNPKRALAFATPFCPVQYKPRCVRKQRWQFSVATRSCKSLILVFAPDNGE